MPVPTKAPNTLDGIRPGCALEASPSQFSAWVLVGFMSRKLVRGLVLGAAIVAAVAAAAYLYLVAELTGAYSASTPRPEYDVAG